MALSHTLLLTSSHFICGCNVRLASLVMPPIIIHLLTIVFLGHFFISIDWEQNRSVTSLYKVLVRCFGFNNFNRHGVYIITTPHCYSECYLPAIRPFMIIFNDIVYCTSLFSCIGFTFVHLSAHIFFGYYPNDSDECIPTILCLWC